jgi:hypothetical protein
VKYLNLKNKTYIKKDIKYLEEVLNFLHKKINKEKKYNLNTKLYFILLQEIWKENKDYQHGVDNLSFLLGKEKKHLIIDIMKLIDIK